MTTRADTHSDFRYLAAAAVDGRIDPDDAVILEAHLLTCSACRTLQTQLMRDHRWLAEPDPTAEPPARIRAAVLDAARAPHRRGQDRTTWLLLAAASLVIVVAGVASFGLRRPAPVGFAPEGTLTATLLPDASSSPSPSPSLIAPAAIGEGVVFGKEGTTATFPFAISASGFHEAGTGSVHFSDPDGTEWTGTVVYIDYWWDPGGSWYVAFLEGCRPTADACRSFVMQLVDGRERADRHDEVSLSWMTRTTYSGHDWELWYGVSSGTVEVAAPADVHP